MKISIKLPPDKFRIHSENGYVPVLVQDIGRPRGCQIKRKCLAEIKIQEPLIQTRAPSLLGQLAPIERIRAGDVLPRLLLGVHMDAQIRLVEADSADDPRQGRPLLSAPEVICNHDKRAHAVEVDPVPVLLGGLERDFVPELHHHVLGAVDGRELPSELCHVENEAVRAGPEDQGHVLGSGVCMGVCYSAYCLEGFEGRFVTYRCVGWSIAAARV
jgi:hypothetical protein